MIYRLLPALFPKKKKSTPQKTEKKIEKLSNKEQQILMHF